MDKIDNQILRCLKDNSRMKASDISKEIHLSVSSTCERIKRLETEGIIKKYTIIKDESKLGNGLMALMEINLEHPKYYDSFTDMIRNNDNIVSCYYVTGDFDFMVRIICKSSDELELIHRQIKSVNGVLKTKTNVILKNVKESY